MMRRYPERVILLPEGLPERSMSAVEHVQRRRQPQRADHHGLVRRCGESGLLHLDRHGYIRSRTFWTRPTPAQPAIHARSPSERKLGQPTLLARCIGCNLYNAQATWVAPVF